MEHKKILLVHLYSNGDCLYATAVARQIKKDFPGCHLTWAIAGFCKSIIDHNPDVDAVLEVNEVKKNDTPAYRKWKRKIRAQQAAGMWDEVFFTQNMDANLKYYDGTIRGMILRAYPRKVKNVQPELRLTSVEIERVQQFADKYALHRFKNIILWEYAPQSGQSELTFDFVMRVSKKIVQMPDTCIILTSANQFNVMGQIFDASELSIRENAALTHYCTLLIGCSSGITWLSTSTAARMLPMIQLLNPHAAFRNIPSVDFERYGLPLNELVELFRFDEALIYEAVKVFIDKGITAARQQLNQSLPPSYVATRNIVYNLLCYGNISGIKEHIGIIKSVDGDHMAINNAVYQALAGFPKKLLGNLYKKKLARYFTAW